MPDAANPFALNQQEALLREIRDELKTSRQVSATGSSGGSRPSPGFIQAQHTADRMIAGEWAQMGWAGAYQTSIKSSLASDIMGSMGLRAAPQSMWQREYEMMSKSMFTDRLTSFPADLLMPGFGRRSRDMGAQLYQLSARFNRSGDNGDVNFHGVMNMARELQLGAASDMRLGGADYNAILSHSANAGQFDMAGGTGDVKAIFNELKSAVADLTKTLRVGAGEVAQTMGAFRQFGMVDVADQRRSAEQLGASARVAGLSTAEMAGITRTGMESGQRYGLGAGGSAQLAQNLAMSARSGSRSGLISGSLMAAAGGVQGMVQSQQAAIDRFSSTPEAYYAQLGIDAGGQGSMLGDLMMGISATGGTLGGSVRADALQPERMSHLTGAQRQAGFNRSINQGMAAVGIDPMSADAYGYAYSQLRGQMGDAAGLAYAKQNWTAEGQRQQFGNRMREQMALDSQGRQRDYQMRMENETFTGRLRQISYLPGQALGKASKWAGDQLDWASEYVGISNRFETAAATQDMLGGDAWNESTAFEAMNSARSKTAQGNSRAHGVKLAGAVSTFEEITTTSLGVGFGIVGGAMGFGLGMLGFGPVGGIVGGTAGAIGGNALGSGIARLAFSGSDHSSAFADGLGYEAAFRGQSHVTSIARQIADGTRMTSDGKLSVQAKLAGDPSFRALRALSGSSGKLTNKDSDKMATLAITAAKFVGDDVTAEDIMGLNNLMGNRSQMVESYNEAKIASDSYVKTSKGLMQGVESEGISIASGQTAKAVQEYVRATFIAGDSGAIYRDRAAISLTAAGIAGENATKVRARIDDMSHDERLKLAMDAGTYAENPADFSKSRRYNAFNRIADQNMAVASNVGKGASKRLGELEEKDPEAVFKLIMGEGKPEDEGLRQELIRQDDLNGSGLLGRMKKVGDMDSLLKTSNDETFTALSGLPKEKLEGWRKQASAAYPGDTAKQNAAIKSAAGGQMAFGSTAIKQANDPANIASNNMILAASILKQIASDLGVKSATGTTP